MPPKFVARNGEDIVAAVARRDEAEVQAIVRANAAQQPPDKTKVKALQEDARKRAAELGLEPEILATKRDLVALAAGNPPAHLRDGWRAGALGFEPTPYAASRAAVSAASAAHRVVQATRHWQTWFMLALVNGPPAKSPSRRARRNPCAARRANNSCGKIDLKCNGSTQASRFSGVEMNQVARLTCESRS